MGCTPARQYPLQEYQREEHLKYNIVREHNVGCTPARLYPLQEYQREEHLKYNIDREHNMGCTYTCSAVSTAGVSEGGAPEF